MVTVAVAVLAGNKVVLCKATRLAAQRRLQFDRLCEQYGAPSAALFATSGQVIVSATSDLSAPLPLSSIC